MGVGGAAVKYSISEYKNAAFLAARGAGFSWGLAEDAGLAAGWLAARGLPFCADILLRARGEFCAPQEDGVLQGALSPSVSRKELCPFVAGALVGDLFRARPPEWRLTRVACPLIFASFVARAAAAAKICVKIQWQNAAIVADGENAARTKSGNLAALRADVRVFRTPSPPQDSVIPVSVECVVAAKEWRKLRALAARTFVPATAESRLHGAGEKND